MRQNLPNVALFVVLAVAVIGGGYYVEKTFFPKPPPPPRLPARETIAALTGGVVYPTNPATAWPSRGEPEVTPVAAKPQEPVAAPPAPAPAKPSAAPTLIALGDDSFFTRYRLTTRGGSVQQVTLREFFEANRLGRAVTRPDGTPQQLRLIPGVARPRDAGKLIEPDGGFVPELPPGKVADPDALAAPSYALLHYPSEDDPLRQPNAATAMNDKYPSPELGEREWAVAEDATDPEGNRRVAFETTLASPYFLKLRKVFTLKPSDYHAGFAVEIEALPGRKPHAGRFRYQIAGPRGVPIEGEWYTQTYRNVFVGKLTSGDAARRTVEDALTINNAHGGVAVPRGTDVITYAAVGNQYFASALAPDPEQPRAFREQMLEYVRPSREPEEWDTPTRQFLADVSFRAVSYEIDPAPGEKIVHKYLIYTGPMKVRLLKQVVGKAVAGKPTPDPVRPELVDFYTEDLTLRTLTDYQSTNFIGRVAGSIGWSDVVIASTNVMHGFLGFLHRYAPSWGLDIILLTITVRLLLFPFSRRQQASMAAMQEKQARLKPEMDKLAEKFKDDPTRLQQEKTKLMFQNGVNPLSAMGGCLLLFAQMPIFMGLYFCLQESVFFRLQQFLWVPNLAAPDMTLWWTEGIPYVSTPSSLGGMTYLGPFLNVLPLVAVTLIFVQQYITMPVAQDEQQEMQQKMMKFMVVIMAVFFYKVAAGLCIYFICSTSWAIAERKLIKKPVPKLAPVVTADLATARRKESASAPPATGFMARMRAKLEETQRLADEQAKRQIRNKPLPDDGRKRKKK